MLHKSKTNLHNFFRKSVLEIMKLEIILLGIISMLFSRLMKSSQANHMKQPIDKIPCESSV